MLNHLCPGCGKHCYLDEAKCERGIEHASTEIMPPRKPRPEGAHGKRHSEQKMKYLAMSQEDKKKVDNMVVFHVSTFFLHLHSAGGCFALKLTMQGSLHVVQTHASCLK